MNRKRRRRRRFALLVLLAMILAAALGIQFRIRPMLRAVAEIQVVNAASSALAGAVNRQMAEGTADYGGLISFEKDETGQITAMRTDTGQIARLKAEVFGRAGRSGVRGRDPRSWRPHWGACFCRHSLPDVGCACP